MLCYDHLLRLLNNTPQPVSVDIMLTHELITTKCAADKTGHFPDYYDWVVIFNADLYLALQKRFSP